MKENRKKQVTADRRIRRLIVLLVSLALIACGTLVWWTAFDGEGWYRYVWHGNHEPFTLAKETNTDPLYSDDQFRQMISTSNFINLYDVNNVVKNSYVIPGLKATKTITSQNAGKPSMCTSMTPQGVTVTDQYVLVSAYCHTHKHDSVIYVIDKKTHRYVKTLVLYDKSHVGSIAYDAPHKQIWVCCYNDENHYAYVRSFSLDALEKYSFEKNDYYPIRYTQNHALNPQLLKRASFMNCRNNGLYVGYFEENNKKTANVICFSIKDDGSLQETKNEKRKSVREPSAFPTVAGRAKINGGAQGFAAREDIYAIIQSGGSDVPSRLMLFYNTVDDDETIDATDANAAVSVTLPSMAEEICMDDTVVYIAFESAAYAFRARKSSHIDRILVLK